ncbi:UDP-2,4-diacetamido-2,4,6-trideoxy-beta-L-altropyranose hydrolase [Salinisphaera sp.]|uniref:UDP-2,4-diacetamido-2,4, 6-trideoxy-beta-L-altropyranose hydrolase n=1 Tax=Salinisphaera sp. TaxID=1914330 RepID=UPI00344BCB38
MVTDSPFRCAVFRVDASIAIGTGHVMRCLTVADALAAQGVECHFICRTHSGHMINVIRSHGFKAHPLPPAGAGALESGESAQPPHAAWLGVSWQEDAEQTREVTRHLRPDWLVVDHYALDKRWEESVSPRGCRLLVIDDLADRGHSCDLLLDQNLGRVAEHYSALVPPACLCLTGPDYALLRSEFPQMRAASLARRAKPQLKRLLITMGGVDKDDITGKVLDALGSCDLAPDVQIEVVLGRLAPWLDSVRDKAAAMPRLTRVAVDVNDMARRMTEADFAIGAAGSTSWERCCLGLPALTLVLAENQTSVANALSRAGACKYLEIEDLLDGLPECWGAWTAPSELSAMAYASAAVTDGSGVERLSCQMAASVG